MKKWIAVSIFLLFSLTACGRTPQRIEEVSGNELQHRGTAPDAAGSYPKRHRLRCQ